MPKDLLLLLQLHWFVTEQRCCLDCCWLRYKQPHVAAGYCCCCGVSGCSKFRRLAQQQQLTTRTDHAAAAAAAGLYQWLPHNLQQALTG
jgi:hypothetical protein